MLTCEDPLFGKLDSHYPPIGPFLDHKNVFQLLIAVILSAQCTDAMVNRVTPTLFATYPNTNALAAADPEAVAVVIRSINYCNTKARHIVGTAMRIRDHWSGQVPSDIPSLITLPGVGRKTANVVRCQFFEIPAIPVDTHVKRLANRMGLTRSADPVRIEHDLMAAFPIETWTRLSALLIVHGREICKARAPTCASCVLNDLCPKVGVSPDRLGTAL